MLEDTQTCIVNKIKYTRLIYTYTNVYCYTIHTNQNVLLLTTVNGFVVQMEKKLLMHLHTNYYTMSTL